MKRKRNATLAVETWAGLPGHIKRHLAESDRPKLLAEAARVILIRRDLAALLQPSDSQDSVQRLELEHQGALCDLEACLRKVAQAHKITMASLVDTLNRAT